MKRWIPRIPAAAGGGPTLITNGKGPGDSSSSTTPSLNTTGANFIVIAVNSYGPGGAVTVTDSKSNTWTALTQQVAGESKSRLYYCYAPTVGTGHTFNATGGSFYGSIYVQAWAGMAASTFDVENGNASASSASTLQPGSVTPSQANELIITALAFNDNSAGIIAVNSSFAITDTVAFSFTGGSMAWLIVSSTSAVNPTWNTTNNCTNRAATIATFKY